MNCELCNHPAGLCKVVTTSSTGGVIEQTLCSACYDRLRRYLYARRERLGGAKKQKPLWHTAVPAKLDLGGEVKPYGQDAPCKFFRSFLIEPGDEEPHHVLCGLSRVPIESCRCNCTCKEYANAPGTAKIRRAPQCKE